MIFGERVRLRAVETADLARYTLWLNDPEVRDQLSIALPMGLLDEEHYLAQVRAQPQERHPYAVEIRVGDAFEHVGGAGFHALDWRTRQGEIGLFVGEKELWGQGLGTDITRTLVRHGFATLNLNRVALRVYEDNARARQVYERVGFVLEGRLRDGDYRLGKYRDVLLYSILRREWDG